ncbi:Protocadherin Fat 4 [Mactra antiquata]
MKGLLISVFITFITSKNICQCVPVFHGIPATRTLPEDFPIGTVLMSFTVTGSDYDITTIEHNNYATQRLVKLNITGEPEQKHVDVITIDNFDRDGNGDKGYPGAGSVVLQFIAWDSVNNHVVAIHNIYLVDVNDNSPVLKNIPYTWEIKERNESESIYRSIRAEDYDDGINGTVGLFYQIKSDSVAADYNKVFTIDNSSGDVSVVLRELDYETNSFYQFIVNVTDQRGVAGCLSSTADFIIKILDVQDTPPFFIGIPYRKTIIEEQQSNTFVLQVSAIDGDRGIPNNINYTILKGPCSDLFNISDGKIHTSQVIDRDTGDVAEQSGVCILTIEAQEEDQYADKQFGETKATTNVTIIIEDVNDSPPIFNVTGNVYQATVQENTPQSVPITLTEPTEIFLEDADEGTNARITLSLFYPNGTRNADFYISPNVIDRSGSTLIRVNDPSMLDFEERANITFYIQATDPAKHVVNATVVLHIEDMNDNNPQFENSSYVFDIPENSKSGTTVGTIQAPDRDSDKFGPVTYAIYGGEDKFHIDFNSGIITTSCANCNISLDRESNSIHFLTLTATDRNGTTGGRSNSTSLVVNLQDVNDNAPEFQTSTYPATIYENDVRYNETNGTAILQVKATDRDKDGTNNSVVEFIIHRTSEDLTANFSMNSTTGELFLVKPLDYEALLKTAGIVEIIVHAIDFGEPRLTGTATVSLQVQDINDETPVFNQTQFDASILENATSSVGKVTTVTQVFVSDDDGTEPNNKVQYFIADGAWSDFSINASTGEINVQIDRRLNRDFRPSYNITILAIDMGSPPLTGTTMLKVDINDVNDKHPIFNPRQYSESVREDDVIGYSIVSVTATDTDIDHELEYSIVDIDATDENGDMVNTSLVGNYFDIYPSNGSIYVSESPDREIAKTVTLTVLVKDIKAFDPPLQNDTASVTITIQDVNDNYPQFEPSSYSVNVSENTPDQTILLTVNATDKDEDRTIRYGIVSVEHEEYTNSFSIDATTGVLRKTGFLDREQHANIILNISATDNGKPPLNSTTTVDVTVLDFNDNAPVFINLSKTVHIFENASINDEVLVVYAKDIDEGPNANVTYMIESGDHGQFIIDPIHGNISVNGGLDREILASYNLRIIAEDNPINAKEKKEIQDTITIIIDDVNDNAPEFTQNMYTADVREDENVHESVITISAVDKDEPNTDNSKITYSFSNNTDGLFRIDGSLGVIHINKSLIGKVGSYVVGLVATDNGNPSKQNDSSFVNITVHDVNLNTPEIVNLTDANKIKVFECVDDGFEIYQFEYRDLDHGQNAEAYFNISKIEDDDEVLQTFDVEPDGKLKTLKKLDAGKRNEYKFQIQVTDKGFPPRRSEKVTITMIVLDVDDHLPTFLTNSTTMSVKENQQNGTLVGSVTAIDPDSDSVSCYSLETGGVSSLFEIGEKTGAIKTLKELDYEEPTGKRYTFHVKVKDCSIPENVTDCAAVEQNKTGVIEDIEVTVNVIDVNDNPPVFQNEQITVGMRRVTEIGVLLDLSLKTGDYVQDMDTISNGRLVWVFDNSGPIQLSDSLSNILDLEGVETCMDGKKHIVCVTGNGTLTNNKYYNEDMSGYFIVPVTVSDAAGSDTTNIKIFLISDSQILKMTLLGRKEEIAEKKNDIMKLYSTITGYTFVYDWVEDHKTQDGRVETIKTDLYFHVVDPVTQEVLPTYEAIRIVDSHYDDLLQAMEDYKVLAIVSSVIEPLEEPDPKMTVYIMAAVIAVLVVSVIVIVYVSMTTRNRYKSKLRAASFKPQDITQKTDIGPVVVPGSNVYSKQSNPLLFAEIPMDHAEYDNISMGSQNSLDKNDVGNPRTADSGIGTEEREVTLDMFTEDRADIGKCDNPLDEALKLHEQIKNRRASQAQMVEPTTKAEPLEFQNFAFEEEIESTEI